VITSRIFTDKQSGKDTEREGLKLLRLKVEAGGLDSINHSFLIL
jgi:hypothetical protein